MTCVCGHSKADHYEYVLNGHDQTRCRSCDPVKHRGPGNYVISGDEAAMFYAADHDFAVPA